MLEGAYTRKALRAEKEGGRGGERARGHLCPIIPVAIIPVGGSTGREHVGAFVRCGLVFCRVAESSSPSAGRGPYAVNMLPPPKLLPVTPVHTTLYRYSTFYDAVLNALHRQLDTPDQHSMFFEMQAGLAELV